jgi:hypothetical protein
LQPTCLYNQKKGVFETSAKKVAVIGGLLFLVCSRLIFYLKKEIPVKLIFALYLLISLFETNISDYEKLPHDTGAISHRG